MNLFPNSINYVPKFAFNHNLLTEFKDIQYAPFRVPVIYGFCSITTQTVSQGAHLSFVLISRKDSRRMGRRFITRGLDRDGNAANFVETEHMYILEKPSKKSDDLMSKVHIATHVQIRGSIPLQWSMKPNLKWAPPVVIHPDFDVSIEAARKHVTETSAEYQN